MRGTTGGILLAALLAMTLPAQARTITVDGAASDWDIFWPPASPSTGHLDRTPAGEGAYLWLDATGDERTDFTYPNPDTQVDLKRVMITSDTAYLYFGIEMTGINQVSGDGVPMVQIAIDRDRIDGYGQDWFAANADTKVANSARWEYLVETRFFSGNSVPAVRLTDWSYAATTDAQEAISTSSGLIEVRVRWADIGGVPTAPIRFSVASFRSNGDDSTYNSGDAGVSNALDAVTNYGAPGVVMNTWEEVADQVVDYHFDVWFHLDPDTEPAPPVVINELEYDCLGDDTIEEWLELYNQTGAPFDLAGFRVSDEETVRMNEGTWVLPAGATIPAGDVVVIAQEAFGFSERFKNLYPGLKPDFEAKDAADPYNDAQVPDLLLDSTKWSTGTLYTSLGLSNSGDELLLVDRSYTIIDAVAYKAGNTPGVDEHPGTNTAYSLERVQPSQDTDDCRIDFFARVTPTPGFLLRAQGDECTSDEGCETDHCVNGICCETPCLCGGDPVDCSSLDSFCGQGACDPAQGCVAEPIHEGLDCTDASLCTSGEKCVGGTCIGTGVDCSNLDDACLLGVCDPGTGTCGAEPAHEGETCDDTLKCTLSDHCTSGSCGGTPKDCSSLDSACSVGVCDPADGACRAQAINEGGACDDSQKCTGNDRCTAGQCQGTALDCGSQDGACTQGVCDPADGACKAQAINEGGVCEDGLLCTLSDHCTAGACGGTARDCSGLDVTCKHGVCDPADGACKLEALPEGDPCSDGDLCTEGDQCAGGFCVAQPKDCSAQDSACSQASCNAGNGACEAQPVNEGGACNDNSLCTTGDHCTAGSCSGTAKDCSSLDDACHVGACDAGSGTCQAQPANEGGGCDDNDPCTAGDHCTAGSCGGTPKDCSSLDGNCLTGTCNPGTGVCEQTAALEGAACTDGDLCTVNDTCQGGLCGGNPKDCSGVADACHTGVCNAGDGSCQAQVANEGGACDDGKPCTLDDTCQAGLCGGAPKDCTDLSDACNIGSCNAGSGACEAIARPDGITCSDGDACTSGDTCQAGLCTGAPKDCSPLDDICVVGVCDPADGNCKAQAAGEGGACDDGDACTSGDSCQGGSCAGTAKDCSSLTDGCNQGSCDPTSGDCVQAAFPGGTACDDGDACTIGDACSDGACAGVPKDCTEIGDDCNTGSCNAVSGQCERQAKADATACEDGNPCTAGDSCLAGVCIAGEEICQDGDTGACGCATEGLPSTGLLGLLALAFGLRRRRG